MIPFQNEFWPPNITETILMINFVQKLKKILNEISKKKCLNVLLGLAVCLSVCQSLHTLKTTYLCGCWVAFQFWFGVGGTWIGVWIFVIWGVDFLGGFLGILMGHILLKYFFTFFLK